MNSVLWSDAAEQDLEEIRVYSEDQWGTETAVRYMRRILNAADHLGSGLIAIERADSTDQRYLKLVVGSHVI